MKRSRVWIGMGALLAATCCGTKVAACSARRGAGRTFGSAAVTLPAGWRVGWDCTQFLGSMCAVTPRPGEVLELWQGAGADPTKLPAQIRVFHLKPQASKGAAEWVERMRQRWPATEIAPIALGAAFHGMRLDYQGAYSEHPLESAGFVVDDARVVVVALDGPGGLYAFELVGAASAVSAALPDFEAMLATLRSAR